MGWVDIAMAFVAVFALLRVAGALLDLSDSVRKLAGALVDAD